MAEEEKNAEKVEEKEVENKEKEENQEEEEDLALPGIPEEVLKNLSPEQKKQLEALKEQFKELVKSKESKSVEKFLEKRDARIVQAYVAAIIEKFGRYIKAAVVWGSKKTGVGKKKSSDIDVVIIVDDTDVKRMTRTELKEKLFQRLCEMSFSVDKRLHPQPYLLTEFWEYVREGNPVLFNVLRDGVVVFDTGFFMPMQILMNRGEIKPSKESIDKHIAVADELMELAKSVLVSKLSYDLEQAVVSSAQAVLMELGYRPPAPKEVPGFVKEVIVEKEKLADESYAKTAEIVVKTYKDIEHQEKKNLSGREFDSLFKQTQKFVKRMKEILKKLRKDKGESWLYEIFEKEKKETVKRDGMVAEEEKPQLQEKAEEIIKQKLGQR